MQELEELALKVMATQQETQARLEARREEMAAVVSEFERKKKEVRCHTLLVQLTLLPYPLYICPHDLSPDAHQRRDVGYVRRQS